MKLTMYSDYCLRVLIFLAIKNNDLATIREIAERYDISRNHLMKVVYELNRMGYIETIRGKRGGMRLAREPAAINLGELIRRTENDFALAECFSDASGCRISDVCRLRHILGEALDAFFAVLDAYTLEALLSNRDQLQQILVSVETLRAPEPQ